MDILITGSSGFLGQSLIQWISKKRSNWHVTGVDIKPCGTKIDFIQTDLSEAAKWENIFLEKDVDIVFDLAGVYKKDNQTMLNINTIKSFSLLEYITKSNIDPIVVIIGSSTQYGSIEEIDLPVNEEYPQNPDTFYGLTKKWQEELNLFYYRTYGIKVICTRPSNFIGKGITKNLLPGYLTNLFKENKNEIIVEISSKKSVRDYIDVRDVSAALIMLSENKSCIGECFNISSSAGISNEDLIRLFEINSKKKANINEIKNNITSKRTLSNKKLVSFTNWVKTFSIEESINWCIND